MALSTTASRIAYAGNGATTAFSFPYYFLAQGDLVVILRVDSTAAETTKTITTHYTVAGAGVAAGGTVTMLTAPASGETLIIYRDPAATQGLDLAENDSSPAESQEQAHDRAMMVSQRLKDRLDRTVRLTDGFSPTFDLKLPSNLNEAADKVPVVNSAGTGWADCDDWPTASDIENAEEEADAAAISAAAALSSEMAADVSEAAAAASAASAAATLASAFYRDVVYITSASSPVTVAQAQNGYLYVADTSGGAITFNLPSIAGVTMPFNVAVLIKTAGNTLTVNRNGSDTIMGATSKAMAIANVGAHFIADTGAAPDDWSAMDIGTVGDLAITEPKLALLVFNALTTVTPVAADFVPLADTSDSGNKKKAAVSALRNAVYRSVITTDPVGVDDETMNLSGASFTSTLPTAVGVAGKRYKYLHSGTSFSQVYTLATTSAQTIGGVASGSYALYTNGEVLEIESDGANWIIVGRHTSTPWTSYSPTISAGFGTTSQSGAVWRRIGDSVQVNAYWTNGTVAASLASVTLPGSSSVNATKFARANTTAAAGHLVGHWTNAGNNNNGRLVTATGTDATLIYFGQNFTTGSTAIAANGSTVASSSVSTIISFEVPVVGWQP
jgi:hypothetical protein